MNETTKTRWLEALHTYKYKQPREGLPQTLDNFNGLGMLCYLHLHDKKPADRIEEQL